MISPTANLLLGLRDTISNLADPDGKKYFSFTDQETGQLEQAGNSSRYPITFPCVLIDFEEIRFTAASDHVQSGLCTVCLKVAFPPNSASDSMVPDAYLKKALYYYDLEQILYLLRKLMFLLAQTPK